MGNNLTWINIEAACPIGGFRAVRLPGQPTCMAELLRASVSNNHDRPEFYLGNAWACPGLEPPVAYIYVYAFLTNLSSVISMGVRLESTLMD